LPCAGIALHRGFRFWLPDPDPNNPYTEFKFGDVLFSVESAPGKAVDLSAKVRPVLQAQVADLTVDASPKTVKNWIAQINKIIASEPTLSEAGKASWLTLSYDTAGAGRLGTLSLEYFLCLKFNIQISATFARSTGSETMRVGYSPDGTVILANDATSYVPPFEGTRIDKCNPNMPPVTLCAVAPNFTLKINSTIVQAKVVKLDVTPSSDPGLSYLWEVQDAKPAMGNGPSFTTTLNTFGTKLVTVTAYTNAGCRVVQSTQVTVLGRRANRS